MKIIDLLNKIANGEEVPKKLLYKYYYKDFHKEYHLKWNIKYKGYYTTNDKTPITHLLADNLWNLNDEVEIIEEDKKIEKLKEYASWSEDVESNIIQLLEIKQKINEIIDEVNKLKDDRK